jgi:ankyrin repeat protein
LFPLASLAGSYDDFFVAIRQDNAPYLVQLLDRGFDPNTPGPDGQYGLTLAIRAESVKTLQALLSHPKTMVDLRNAHDETPLMLASLKGNLAACKALIARDADVNKTGWTALHYAATGGHTEIVQLLLDHYAYIDAESPNGSTPLMMAAMYSDGNTVRILLERGADASIKNQLGLTALDFAQRAKRPDAVEVLSVHARPKFGPAW